MKDNVLYFPVPAVEDSEELDRLEAIENIQKNLERLQTLHKRLHHVLDQLVVIREARVKSLLEEEGEG